MQLPVASITTSSVACSFLQNPSSPVLVISTRPACRSFPSSQITTSPNVRWMSIPTTRRIGSSCQHNDGSGGRHDTYGSALSAQPGESQRRPATNSSSKLILYIGLPAHSCSRCLCPGWSHHTPQLASRSRNIGTGILIPVTNAIEALNSKLRRAVRTRGHLPGDDAAMKLLYLRPQQGGRGMETAAARVVGGKNPVRRDLRRTVRHLMTITGPAHKITDSPIRRITPRPRAS